MQLSKLENSVDKKISRPSSDDCVLLLNPLTWVIAIWETMGNTLQYAPDRDKGNGFLSSKHSKGRKKMLICMDQT